MDCEVSGLARRPIQAHNPPVMRNRFSQAAVPVPSTPPHVIDMTVGNSDEESGVHEMVSSLSHPRGSVAATQVRPLNERLTRRLVLTRADMPQSVQDLHEVANDDESEGHDESIPVFDPDTDDDSDSVIDALQRDLEGDAIWRTSSQNIIFTISSCQVFESGLSPSSGVLSVSRCWPRWSGGADFRLSLSGCHARPESEVQRDGGLLPGTNSSAKKVASTPLCPRCVAPPCSSGSTRA